MMMRRAMTILSFENSSADGIAKDAYPNDVDQDEDNLAQGWKEK